jgi:hypothetical protein
LLPKFARTPSGIFPSLSEVVSAIVAESHTNFGFTAVPSGIYAINYAITK